MLRVHQNLDFLTAKNLINHKIWTKINSKITLTIIRIINLWHNNSTICIKEWEHINSKIIIQLFKTTKPYRVYIFFKLNYLIELATQK